MIWQPGEEHLRNSNIARFMNELGFKSYAELHRWSVQNRAEFWEKAIKRLDVRFAKKPDTMLDLTDGVKNPHWLPGAELNCADSCFKAESDKPAIISAGEGSSSLTTTTYADLERLVNRIANGLRESGIRRAQRIALYMPMNVECVAAYLGIIRAGCQVVSIADSFSPAEVNNRMENAETDWVITVQSYLRAGRTIELYQKIKKAGDSRAIVIPSDRAALDLREGDILWNDFLSSSDKFFSVTGHPYTTSNILFSSGTTGTPKVIPWTHLTPIKSAMDGHFHQDINPGDVVSWPTNIGWMMGPWLIYAVLFNNATMALFEGTPGGKGFINFIREAKVTILGVTPSLVRVWRTSNVLEETALQKIRVFSSTGEPSNREDYLWLMSRAGYKAPVIEYLGGTEIGGGHLTGSVVHAASPATFTTSALGMDFVLLNDENRPVTKGEAGELFLIPPSIGLSQELLNKDHEEIYYAGCPEGPNGEILRRHGDRIVLLDNGFLKAQGRADDTMNLGGIKVSSLELEQAIGDHASINECAAVAVQPEGEGQEKLVVFVVIDEIADKQTLKKELGSKIAKRLNPLFKMHDLVIVDDLPRTASNKLMRRKLRECYSNHIQE